MAKPAFLILGFFQEKSIKKGLSAAAGQPFRFPPLFFLENVNQTAIT
jgi:hypothetical protein